MTAKARIIQSDVTRAVRGVLAAGVNVAGIRIMPDGEIVILSEVGAESVHSGFMANPLDEVLLNAPQGKTAR